MIRMEDSLDNETETPLESFVGLLRHERGRIDARRLAQLVSVVLGDRIEVGDASRYIYHYARRCGYDIPPYPLAGCGEIRQFFAEEGVENVPEWYAKIGISAEDYERLHEKTIVALRNARNERTVFLMDGMLYRQDKGFADLRQSGLIQRLEPEALSRLLGDILAFSYDG